MKRIKANFDAEEAITYMRHGGKLYLDGWVYWYNERMILQDISPILMTRDSEEAKKPWNVLNLWSNLYRAEMDEPCFITRENLEAIAKRYDVGPREVDIEALAGQNFNLIDMDILFPKSGEPLGTDIPDQAPESAGLTTENEDLKAEVKAMARHIDSLSEIIKYMLK